MLRIFYAHARPKTPEDEAALVRGVEALTRHAATKLAARDDGRATPEPFEITTGAEDWTTRFRGQARGNYDRWTQLVAQGRGPSGEPYYDVFVIPIGPLAPAASRTPSDPRPTVGRATDTIAVHAAGAGKAVLAWDGEILRPVVRLIPLRGEGDWQRFSVLVLGS